MGYKVMLLENAELPSGMVFRYNGAAGYARDLFYSSAYEAYVCIVPDDETVAGARAKLATVSGTLISIIYDGDVNEDTLVNILDAVIALDLYLNDYTYTITDLMRFKADVTGDKTVDIEDVLWILNESLDR